MTRPVVWSTSRWATTSVTTATELGARPRQVYVGNAGLGTGIVRDVRYTCDTATGLSTLALRARLRDRDGLYDDVHYTLANYRPGFPFAPGDRRLLLECSEQFLERFTTLEATLEVDSLLGRRYRKVVSLLPHPGAPGAARLPG